MKKNSILLLLLTVSFFVNGQIHHNSGDTLFVWASEGINIFSNHYTNSEVLSHAEYGEKLLVLDCSYDSTISVVMNSPCLVNDNLTPVYKAKGKMIKVKFYDLEGYVFDVYLARIQPIEKYKSFDRFLEENIGIIKSFEHNKEPRRTETVYKNGIVRYITSFGSSNPGCLETTYIIPGLSLHEGFLIAYHLLGLKERESMDTPDCICAWHFVKLDDQYIEIDSSCEAFTGAYIRSDANFISIKIGIYM